MLTLRLDDGETAVFTDEKTGEVVAKITHVHRSGRRAKLVIEAPRNMRIDRQQPNQFDLQRLRRA